MNTYNPPADKLRPPPEKGIGRALLFARAGIRPARPRGQPAIAAAAIAHIRGRTEFAPARVVGYESDGRPRIEKLGR